MKEIRNTLLFLAVTALVIIFAYRFFKPLDAPLQRPMGAFETSDGSILVADGGGYYWNDSGSKVIRVGKDRKIKWTYRGNLSFVHGASLLQNGHTLIVDTGNDRLLETNNKKNNVWNSVSWGRTKRKKTDGTLLSQPASAVLLKNGRFLIVDGGNGRIVETDRGGKIFMVIAGLSLPKSVRLAPGGNFILAESGMNRVVEFGTNGKPLWQYTNGLSSPADASVLSNGSVLIADTGNDRVIVVDRKGKIEKEIVGMLNRPNGAILLRNGNILVSDTGHARLVEFDAQNKPVWDFRNIKVHPLREELTNGGAEDFRSRRQTGWIVCDLETRRDGEWSTETNFVHSGKNSLGLKTVRMVPANLYWGQVVKAQNSSVVELTAFVKSGLSSGAAGIGILFQDPWNGTIGSTNVPLKGLTNDWKQLSLRTKVPDNADALFIRLYLDGAGSALFDDVSLQTLAQ